VPVNQRGIDNVLASNGVIWPPTGGLTGGEVMVGCDEQALSTTAQTAMNERTTEAAA